MEQQDKPIIVNAECQTYYFCTCKMSKNFPYCDGSHSNTAFTPHVTTLTEPKTIAICACGKSASIFCDGSHTNIK